MNDYFESEAIGSSLLADCIESLDPLVVCTDRATVEKAPTSSMETGKIFEDLVQHTYGKHAFFWEKYFKSNLSSYPSGVVELLDKEDFPAAIDDCVNDPKHYTKKGELSKTYARKVHFLNQIKAHDYRIPITTADWQTVEAMFDRFQSHPFQLLDFEELTVHEWMTEYAEVMFQVPFFWEIDGAKCRAKWDMIWLIKEGNEKPLAVPLDLKKAANTHKLRQFWRDKYIWQSEHYMEGFKLWCLQNGYDAHDRMYYAAYEAEEPYLAHLWSLHPDELEALRVPYREALPIIQNWIDAGSPVNGYTTQQDVNRWGRIYD